MSDFPLVSIITPSFNQAAFLEKAMESVLSQSFPNLEYWVIDGKSSDGSIEIIRKYEDRLTGWISERDSGQADGINKGFQRAKGEIVAWLNSDDIYRPGAIASAVAALQQHPQAGLVFSDVDSIDADGNVFNVMTYGDWSLEDLMTFHIIGQPGVFMRRSVLEKVGQLDPSYKYLLDHHLWLRMGLISEIKYIQGQTFAAARIHPAAKNVAQAKGFGAEAYQLVDWMLTDPAFAIRVQGIEKKIQAGAHRFNAFYLLDAGEPKQALKAYWQGFWKYPPAVLPDWRRILYALFNPLGLEGIKARYYERRKSRIQGNK